MYGTNPSFFVLPLRVPGSIEFCITITQTVSALTIIIASESNIFNVRVIFFVGSQRYQKDRRFRAMYGTNHNAFERQSNREPGWLHRRFERTAIC